VRGRAVVVDCRALQQGRRKCRIRLGAGGRRNGFLGIADDQRALSARILAGTGGRGSLAKKGRSAASIRRAWPTIAAIKKQRNRAVKTSEKSVMERSHLKPPGLMSIGNWNRRSGSPLRRDIFASR
jgi:hypothetical protein